MPYDNDNIFAKILRGELPAFTVYENDHCLAFLDVMPQSDGHTLVLPKQSAQNLFDLDDESAKHLIITVRKVAGAVRDAFSPDGIRLMQLNGEAAGQTVMHLHMHIVPCYANSTPRSHAQQMAESDILEKHAAKIRAAIH
ncbi:MAG: HIT family protein [Gammaproteobacteria bacterium]|jgi:histidine triad (HIT) family protein|nr:HIT family protein [Chromatiales bacterium]MDP6675236.1 HIT family protein [Gammaproteobacteria bacterium]